MDLDLQTPQDIIEGETCGVLVSLLGHLADLVDHSASVFSGLHAEVISSVKQHEACVAAEISGKALSTSMADLNLPKLQSMH